VRHSVRDSVRYEVFHLLMRTNHRAFKSAAFRAVRVAPLAVAVLAAGCSEPAETVGDRRAEDIVAVSRIGPPLPDAVDERRAWVPLNGALYTHRVDLEPIRQWYDQLPERFDCDEIETVGLDGPMPGESHPVTWSLRCYVADGDYWQVIAAATTVMNGEASTSVGAYHERRD